MHAYKNDFQELLRTHSSFTNWFINDRFDGLWFSKWESPEEFWMNDAFLKTLGYLPEQVSDFGLIYNQITRDVTRNKISELFRQAKANSKGSSVDHLQFTNHTGEKYYMEARAFAVAPKALVLKFTLSEKDNKQSTRRLKAKIEELSKLEAVYNETNEIARIGGWDVDLVKNEITWTSVTYDIHEVSRDFIPDMSSGISFYKEGWSKDLITKRFQQAVEDGRPFDEEFKLITAKNREIWIRSFGKPEFKDGKCVRVYGAFHDINTQKKHQLELEAAKNRFEGIFDNSPVGTLLFDFSDNIVAINPSALHILGFEDYPAQTIKNLTFHDFLESDSFACLEELKRELIQNNKASHEIEMDCLHSSGTTVACNVISSIIPGEKASDKFIIAKIQDITNQKRLKRLATENANKFVKAFENSPNGMGVIDLAGRWVMINKNLYQMLGYKKAELLQLNLNDITHPEDREIDKELVDSLLSQEIENFSIEKRYIHKTGQIVHCQLNASAIQNEQGQVSSIINQVVDMTQSIKAQNDLKYSLKDLQDLLDATTQIIIVETDLKHVITKFNKGAERILGYDAEEVVGKMRPGSFHLAEEIEQRARDLSLEHNTTVHHDEVFTFQVRRGGNEAQEWTYKRKDGSHFPVQLMVTAVRNQDNIITGYLGIATDITERKAMEESLIVAKEKAEMASNAKSEFLANMSHEIRTPLNGVIGFTDLLMKTDLTSTQSNYMHTIHSSANSLLDLISDILDFSKIEAGKLELSEQRIDIIELCEQSVELFKHKAHEKGIELLLNISPMIERFVWADALRLKQILINLIGNAIKFTQKGEIELNVKSGSSEKTAEKKSYAFCVRDTGMGIAPQNLSKIFFAFDQEDASTTRKFGGSGLGLTISNRLLNLMESELKVKSKPGAGSKFYFDVCLEPDTTTVDSVLPSRRVRRALIVDDNLNNRVILKEMLAYKKIDVVMACNGIEAIEAFNEDSFFDIAIIDYHMPYVDGLALINHIRNGLHISPEQLPIMLLHSFGEDAEIIQKCREYQVQLSKTKPIYMTDLFDLISSVENPTYPLAFLPKEKQTLEVDLSDYEFTIMVAEDNPVNKHLARTILRKLMPKVHLIEVDNGKEAVEAYKKEKVDLIFMDIQMPVLSGFEATQKIRFLEKKNQLKLIPIIALTARTLNGEKERCLNYEMDAYITKPVVLKTLKKVLIEQLIEKNTKELATS